MGFESFWKNTLVWETAIKTVRYSKVRYSNQKLPHTNANKTKLKAPNGSPIVGRRCAEANALVLSDYNQIMLLSFGKAHSISWEGSHNNVGKAVQTYNSVSNGIKKIPRSTKNYMFNYVTLHRTTVIPIDNNLVSLVNKGPDLVELNVQHCFRRTNWSHWWQRHSLLRAPASTWPMSQ